MIKKKKLISKKKPFYPITNFLKNYLIDFNRWIKVPITYDDLLRFQGSVCVYDNKNMIHCGPEFTTQRASLEKLIIT